MSHPIRARSWRMRRRVYGVRADSRSSARSAWVEKSQSWRRARWVRAAEYGRAKAASRARRRSLRAAGIRARRIARAQGRGASASLGAAAGWLITG
jgi:hypothetical protein